MRRRSPFAIGSVMAAVLIAGCGSGSGPAPGSPSPTQPSAAGTATAAAPAPAATSATALPASGTTPASGAPVEVHVTNCPVPAGDYAGTPYAPRPAPATLSLPASVRVPGNARI
ncbi:MAG TPA: hypothetical protein VGS06_44365, partial [Streptosporangiaceae bacterium]|nr:hypothetical protein [Streptosporangiaceae bacterium]